MGPAGDLWRRRILLVLGILLDRPDAIPGLTIPGDGSMPQTDDMPPMASQELICISSG